METTHRSKKKTTWIVIIIILVAAALAAAGIAYYLNQNKEKNSNVAAEVVPWDTDIEEDTSKADDEIIIPGYAKMTMKANQKEQTVSMGNPADNDCYFIIVLKLADGTVLFESDYLKPGEGMRKITMNQELESGTYQGIIEYKCYSMEDKSPLNGGSAEFELNVQ